MPFIVTNMALTNDAQNSFFLDELLCEEDGFSEDGTQGETYGEKSPSLPLILLHNDIFLDDDDLASLISKERGTHYGLGNLIIDEPLKEAREEAVFWVLKVSAHHNFSALTTVLAVNYFDRFIQSLIFRRDKPWTTQLAAVACLFLAAKVEETPVPHLADLQVEESKYEFEAKDIKRMELLVLSTLQWKMNPVTPISFFGHIVRTLRLKSHSHCEFLLRCERVLLLLLADSKVMSHLPSIIAAATMVHVIRDIEPFNAGEYRNQLLGLLKINEEQVNQCYKLVLKILWCHEDIQNLQSRRERPSEPRSPDGVIDAFFNYDSSNDSWAVGSVSVSEEPMLKKNRSQSQEQPMQLAS
ncbi:cyclin-D3-3-like [Prosopis cineraria]|uniref:cyclin-D3-3-like n=1 Tax=Prosopis cineraria TaxID=364024 RepID=UPI00241036FE|nr:cyclin-D3-3-like [Prosopis cineraria]